MMISMTGYGKATTKKKNFEIEVEIKSVNSKYLDLKVYCSKELSNMEPLFRKEISNYFQRGTIDLRVRVIDYLEPNISVNEAKLKSLKKATDAVSNIFNNGKIPLEFILKEYDIINYKSILYENQAFKDDLLKTVKKAIIEQRKMAEIEGKGIKTIFIASIKEIRKALQEIDSTIPKYRTQLYERMKSRVLDVLPQSSSQAIEQRLMQELAIYLDRYDINEEITRLSEHIDTLFKKLKSYDGSDIGKTLNFILQEMQREANTLGSKYSNKHSFKYILFIKEEIEKCREIIQNVM